MQKNVTSQKLVVYAFDSTTNLPKTGDAANLTAYVSIDYGSVTVLGDTSAAEMDNTNAKGYYLFDLAQAETNGNTLVFSCKSSTANVVVLAVPACVFTVPAGFPSSAYATAADLATLNVFVDTEVAAIKAKTDNLPTDPADQSLIVAATDALATLIGDVPTNAELATALGTADDAVLTQVGLVKAKTDLIPASPAAVGSAMTLDLTQAFTPTDNTETLGGAFAAARAQGFGKWELVGTTLTLYAADGTTPVRTFTLDSATAPTSRT